MKTLDDLIKELLRLQSEGKGKYQVIDGENGMETRFYICDTEKKIIFY